MKQIDVFNNRLKTVRAKMALVAASLHSVDTTTHDSNGDSGNNKVISDDSDDDSDKPDTAM